MPAMKYWEIVADKFSAAGRSWGYCSAVAVRLALGHCAHKGEGKHSDELLSRFLKMEAISLLSKM